MCLVTLSVFLGTTGHLRIFIEKLLVDESSLSVVDRIHNYGAWAAAGKLPIVLLWLADHIVSSALMVSTYSTCRHIGTAKAHTVRNTDILACWRALAIWGPARGTHFILSRVHILR